MAHAPVLSPKSPEHLNAAGCRIQYTEGKGRGVYASRAIPAQTTIEISPVLLFSKEEYDAHGRHTVLDHYTFVWPDGRMALALGIGSLFNHSDAPNVSYIIDSSSDSIRYTTTRAVKPDQELCIFYGFKLWFDPLDGPKGTVEIEPPEEDGGLSSLMLDDVAEDVDPLERLRRLLNGDPDEVIPEDDLPFTQLRITPDEEEEEEIASIKTAWVVDIPHSQHITTMLKWLKHSALDDPALGHLKRVRKSSTGTSLLLGTGATPPTNLPSDLDLPPPYTLAVPRTAALTSTAQALKNTLWPTAYAPRRKHIPEPWTRSQVRWAWRSTRAAIAAARQAREAGELPIAAVVPPPYGLNADPDAAPLAAAHDTRRTTGHPLRHAVVNAIRAIADARAAGVRAADPLPPSADANADASADTHATEPPPQNGRDYLLTGLTLVTTHEPCIMCSMALLHSRVRTVLYLVPMRATGGCGGAACLSRLPGVNHRFAIGVWKAGFVDAADLAVDSGTDA